MFCPTCGQAVPNGERYCANCGTELAAQAAPAPAGTPATAPAPVSAATTPAPAAPGALRGVGGWLLVFCIWITIFSPLMELRVLPYLRYLTLNPFLLVSIGVTAYGVFAGIQLWSVRPQALTHLRIYFGLVLVMTLVSIVTYFRMVRGELLGGIWVLVGWVRAFLFLAVWVAYFRVSQRVRNTYGSNL